MSDGVMIMNEEIERKWKEVVIAYFKALSNDLSAGSKAGVSNLRPAGRIQPA
jgi:hypothetical protein